MVDNMTIGPSLAIGGNQVTMTPKGKIQVTNPEGKIKTLSQDEFKKQLIKNADKIEAGENFEFKKNNTGLKATLATAAVLLASYVGLGVAVAKGKLTKDVAKAGKELGFMSNVKNVFVAIGENARNLWSKTAKATKNVFGNKEVTKDPNPHNVFNAETTTTNPLAKNESQYRCSKDTVKYKQEAIAEQANKTAKEFEDKFGTVNEKLEQVTEGSIQKNHAARQAEYEKALGLAEGQEDTVKVLKRSQIKVDADGNLVEREIKIDPKYKEAWEKAHPKATNA